MRRRQIGTGVVLATTMASATFAPTVFAVLATPVRTEFSAARWHIGALVAVVMGVGAVLSPTAGTFSDRLPPRRAVGVTLVLAALGFFAMGNSSRLGLLAVAAGLAGVGQAMSNPATNRLIMATAGSGRRGLLTGVKQAGVQAGNFLGGLLLPVGVVAVGWRITLSAVAAVPVMGLALLTWLVPPTPVGPQAPGRRDHTPAPTAVRTLTAYAALLGFCGGGLFTYLPLFAQETFGFDTAAGGALVAVFGGVGFLTRLGAGPLSEKRLGHHRTLVVMALFTAVAGVVLAVAPTGGWLWPVAVLIGIGPMAWNVVANLAVMELSPRGRAGRGSGLMMAGFLGGMAIGAPSFGGSVDLLGSYRPGWIVVAILGATAAVVGWRVRNDP